MTKTLNIEALRADTPGCASVVHLDNAGAALMPKPVLEAVRDHLELEATLGGYRAARDQRDALAAVYGDVASLIGAAPNEIALTGSATRGWQLAFYAFGFAPGDRIVTSRAEYAANFIAMLQVARRRGVELVVIDDDEHGQLSVDELRRQLDKRVKLIAITHVPTNGGLVNPAAAVGALAKAHGIPFLLDACQSAGQLPIDVDELGCDLLTATGRKYLRGPRGTGFLYVRRELCERLEPPMLDLHAARWTAPDAYEILPDARRFETWEKNVAGLLGLGAAVRYAAGCGLPTLESRISALADQLRQQLSELPGVTVRDRGERRCGIVSFTVEGVDAEAIQQALEARDINTSSSTVAGTLLDMQARGLDAVVRASVHAYNTEQELEQLCAALTAFRDNGLGAG